MSFSTKDTILDYCKLNNIEIAEQTAEQFETLSDMLVEFNSHTNVTALKTREDIAIKHFADSLALIPPAISRSFDLTWLPRFEEHFLIVAAYCSSTLYTFSKIASTSATEAPLTSINFR